MKLKFAPGDEVSYKPKVSPGIDMKATRVVGFDSVKNNNWKRKYSAVSKDYRNVLTDSGKPENRYIIEHFFGWYPAHQVGKYNPNLRKDLDCGKRYHFAYESELQDLDAYEQ